MGVVRVGGVHGVGKTHTIREAVALSERPITVLKGSDIMAQFLQCDPEDLRLQSAADRQRAREHSLQVERMTSDGVKDSHFAVYNAAGELELVSSGSEETGVTALALIVASAEVVRKRRLLVRRERPTDIDEIERHLGIEQQFAVETSQSLGLPLHIISNNPEDDAAQAMVAVYDRYIH